MSPAALPGGRIVFTILTAGTHQLGMVDLDKPGEHRLLPFSAGGSTPKYIASGHLLYFHPQSSRCSLCRSTLQQARQPAGRLSC